MTRTKTFKLLSIIITLVVSGSLSAQLDEPNNELEGAANYYLDSSDATNWAVIITGPTVGETNQAQFRQWSF